MKRKIILSLLTSFMSHQLLADGPTGERPFLAPDKCAENPMLVQPNTTLGTSSYYYNRDCTVAYVVPPPVSYMQVKNEAFQYNIKLCESYDQTMSSVNKIRTKLAELAVKLVDYPSDSAEAADLLKKQALFENLIKQQLADYQTKPGLIAQMTFQSGLTQDYMANLLLSNVNSVEHGLKIRSAPLSKSYLSFNSVTPGKTQTYSENPVLESNIMGILTKADESNTDRSSIRFNGGATGYVVLNLAGACPIIEGDTNKLSSLKIDKKKLGAYLSVTQTMMVPLVSSFGYKAKLDVRNSVESLYKSFGVNGKFTASQVVDLYLGGDLQNNISIESWTQDVDGEAKTFLASQLSAEQVSKIKESLLQRYLANLTEFNALSVVSKIETPQAGNDVQVGTRRECSSNSFLGIRYSQSCHDVQYQILVPVDGTSNQVQNVVNKLGATYEDSMSIYQPVERVHTSEFTVKE